MADISPAQESFRANFESLNRSLGAAESGDLSRLRKTAMARLGEIGFPGARDEGWRYTNFTPIFSSRYTLGAPADDDEAIRELIKSNPVAMISEHLIVLVNGNFHPGLSRLRDLPRGVTAGSLRGHFSSSNGRVSASFARIAPDSLPFGALNTACFQDGAFIHVDRGVTAPDPIQVVYVSQAQGGTSAMTVSHPRLLAVVEENAEASIVESFIGDVAGAPGPGSPGSGRYLTNPVSELVAGRDSRLAHYRILDESKSAFHVSVQEMRVMDGANVTSQSFIFGGALVRNDIGMNLQGENIEGQLNSLYLLAGDQHIDNRTRIEHAKPNCNTRELFKGVLGGRARSVFSGLIHVWQDAQKTDSKQSNKHLLLSPHARVDSQPQLEIFADDVKCTHGATIGQLDKDAIFYMRARGLSMAEARGLLTRAFAGDVIEYVRHAALRSILDDMAGQELRRDGLIGPSR